MGREGASFKNIAAMFASHPGALPTDFIADDDICRQYAERAMALLTKAGVNRFGVRVHGAGEYPAKLRDAEHTTRAIGISLSLDVSL